VRFIVEPGFKFSNEGEELSSFAFSFIESIATERQAALNKAKATRAPKRPRFLLGARLLA
jgi:hypothetical protein